MNSIAPMSTPRVGCETRRVLDLAQIPCRLLTFADFRLKEISQKVPGLAVEHQKLSMISLTRCLIPELSKIPKLETAGGR